MTQIFLPRPILLIDDSPEDLYLAKSLLEQAAINQPIVTKADGAEAIAFLRTTLESAPEAIPCCVFSDIRMPKVDGFGVLEWSRAQVPLKGIPFSMLTGGDLPEDRKRAEELGADFFLIKFPRPNVFRKIIEEGCGR
jgi:CheY-like chemotaxis protein